MKWKKFLRINWDIICSVLIVPLFGLLGSIFARENFAIIGYYIWGMILASIFLLISIVRTFLVEKYRMFRWITFGAILLIVLILTFI